MTAAHESGGFVHRRQIGGPALGIFQMEPATHDDIWEHYLIARSYLRASIRAVIPIGPIPKAEYMETSDPYACAMARAHYRRVSEPLPDAGDLGGMAAYAKRHWNTPAGAATPQKYLDAYRRHVLDAAAQGG